MPGFLFLVLVEGRLGEKGERWKGGEGHHNFTWPFNIETQHGQITYENLYQTKRFCTSVWLSGHTA